MSRTGQGKKICSTHAESHQQTKNIGGV